jgi:hypothetical protein
MARPNFTLKWAGSRLSIPAISAGNYAAGWDTYLGPLPPLGDDHDYVMNLQDSRAIWLGEQMLLAVGHEWQDDVSYDAYAVVRSPVDGQLYRSLASSNLNNEPSVSGSQWALGLPVPNSILTSGIRGSYSNLSASAVGTNATVSFTADAICVKNAANEQLVLNTVSQSCNLLTLGAGGLDAGSIAANTWYATYLIYNPTTSTRAAIASLSYTGPALPSGFTHWAFMTSVRSNAGATLLLPFTKDNEAVFYAPAASTAIPSDFPIALGNGAATSFTAVSLQALVPPNAKRAILGVTHSGTTAGSILVTRGAAGIASGLHVQCLNNGVAIQRLQFEVARPYANGVYYAINANGVGTIVVMGWKE